MRFRFIGLCVVSVSLLVLGCSGSETSDSQWQQAKERQQEAGRASGRIGYIGNAGAASNQPSDGSTPKIFDSFLPNWGN
jgi:hypothetical protein